MTEKPTGSGTNPDTRKWLIPDFGTATADNGVWLFCENLDIRDKMGVGNTCNLYFKSGMGRDKVEVERIQ